MSTADEDRRTSLAGGAQRALRAARAKAAPADGVDTDRPADAALPDDEPTAVHAGVPGSSPAMDAPAEMTTAADAPAEITTAMDAPAEMTTADAPQAEMSTAADAPHADDQRLDPDSTELDSADPDSAVAAAGTVRRSASASSETVTLAKTDADTAVRASVPVDDAPPEAPRRRPDKSGTRRTPRARTRPPARPARRRMSRLTAVASTLAVLALIFAVVSAVMWWRAGHDDDRDAALARDDVAVSARLAIATVNTSDYRKPANALTNWLEVSTGTLHGQFADSRASAIKLLSQARTITSATVLDAAVTKLDDGKGSATVIASVNVKRKPVTGAATTTRNRFRATMDRVGGEWKLDDLKIVEAQLV